MPETVVEPMEEGTGVVKPNNSAHINTGVYQQQENTYHIYASMRRLPNGSGFMFGNGFTQFNVNRLPDDGNFYDIEVQWTDGRNIQTINNSNVSTLTNSNWNSPQYNNYEIYVLGLGGYSSQTCGAEIATCKIYENEVLVRDLIAATRDNVPGMFDNVTGAFYTF